MPVRLLKRASTNNFLRYYIAYHRYKVPRSNAKARSAVGMDMTRMPRIVDAPFRILSRRATGNFESVVVIRDQISAAGDDDESNPSFLPSFAHLPLAPPAWKKSKFPADAADGMPHFDQGSQGEKGEFWRCFKSSSCSSLRETQFIIYVTHSYTVHEQCPYSWFVHSKCPSSRPVGPDCRPAAPRNWKWMPARPLQSSSSSSCAPRQADM